MRKLPKPPRMPTAHKRKLPPSVRPDPSSNIEAHEYSPETGHLTVTFKEGRQYRYADVSPEHHEGLKAAPSKGSYLHAHIIGKHDVTRI